MNPMLQALYDALYVDRAIFQWITITKYEVIPGTLTRDYTKQEMWPGVLR